MRLDRFITLNLVQPCRRACASPHGSGRALPVLMYHSISDDPEPGVAPIIAFAPAPRGFASRCNG